MADSNPQDFLILAVDDDPANGILMEKLLTKGGYKTKILSDSEKIFSSLAEQKPDLILLDLMMPNIDGLELCKQIKLNSLYQEIPIIFLTASQEKKDLLQAFDLGAVDYLTKPFYYQELLARVKIHLELKLTRDKLNQALREVEHLAKTDELTGIANRRHFYDLAEREFQLAKRKTRNFALLIIDIDHFKQINDTYGHLVGDEAIKFVAQESSRNLRQQDLLARWGGEEFIVFLSDTNLIEALIIANRIKNRLQCQPLLINSEPISLTVSLGLSVYHEQDESLNDTISRADQALYQAKKTGRNKIMSEKDLSS